MRASAVHNESVAVEPSLAERIFGGDPAAEEELVARFYRRVQLLAAVRLRDEHTARDVAQEVMLAVLRAVRAGRLNDHSSLTAYVLGTARNIVNNAIRSRRVEVVASDEMVDPGEIPSEVAEIHEQLDLVRLALDQFDAVDRTVIGLTLVQGLKPGEIALRLGLKPELVRKRKSRAVQKLRDAVHRGHEGDRRAT